jgi:hypothetical protein
MSNKPRGSLKIPNLTPKSPLHVVAEGATLDFASEAVNPKLGHYCFEPEVTTSLFSRKSVFGDTLRFLREIYCRPLSHVVERGLEPSIFSPSLCEQRSLERRVGGKVKGKVEFSDRLWSL